MARLLYFAWVREKVGVAGESLSLPDNVKNVADLIAFLRNLDAAHDQALADGHLRVAVNQNHARLTDPVADQDEIAIFPPVSGV